MKRTALIIFPLILLLSACALEIANVIGPGGGYVFYDKGNYDGGWRYIECSPFDIGELKDTESDSLLKALQLCKEHSGGWYTFEWELPDEKYLKRMLGCFSYGLTKFSPDYYYLAVNNINKYQYILTTDADYDEDDPATWKWVWECEGEVVILHKNFDDKLNGEIEKVTSFPDVVKVRPIRKF
jgi:hypothetical protein